jgi:hypothetical protein
MEEIVKRIIIEQSLIIGESLSREMAIDTGVVKFNSNKIDDITITSQDPNEAVEKLVNSYRNLFGQASVEVCMNVIRKFPQNNGQQAAPQSV